MQIRFRGLNSPYQWGLDLRVCRPGVSKAAPLGARVSADHALSPIPPPLVGVLMAPRVTLRGSIIKLSIPPQKVGQLILKETI